MKKFNKILSLLLALAMMLSLVACGGGNEAAETTAPVAEDTTPAPTEGAVAEYVDPYAGMEYDDMSAAVYDAVLGEYYAYYSVAKEATNVSERQALMALAEAKLMEAALMLPIYSAGGRYAINRLAPYTVATVGWGYSSAKYHTALVANDPLPSEVRAEMKAKWAELKGTNTYLDWAKEFLAEKGFTLKNTFTTTYSSDPVGWDCLATSRAAEGEFIALTWDGLIAYDAENEMIPALAESWEISEDGLTYTFKIREGVKWVDSQGREIGEVTADDWVAGMQHMMDAMGGLEYLIEGIIKNASEYIYGEVTDFAEVGVKAVDTYTLEYTLEAPTSFFMTMLNYSVFAPMNREFYESQGGKFGADYDASAADYLYGTSPDNIAYCGPYLVSNNTAQSTIMFSKNPTYWAPETMNIDTVTFLYNDGSDATKAINDCFNNVIDGVSLTNATIEIAQTTALPEGYTSAKGAENWYDEYAYVSDTDSTSYMAFFNVYRQAMANVNDGAVASTKTEEQVLRGNAAMQNVHFRRALAMSVDRGAYNAQRVGENLKYAALRNCYTPGNFVYLAEDVTVDINGTATTFPAGTPYGVIMQAQIDADGVALTVWDPAANDGVGSSDGYDGWYNPENAVAELALAIEELAAIGVEVSAENPIYVDYPYASNSAAYTNSANALAQSVTNVLGGAVVINLVECVDYNEWYYTGYYTSYGSEANYDIYDLSGWGPDYGDPQTYLDTFLPDYSGYMIKCIGLF